MQTEEVDCVLWKSNGKMCKFKGGVRKQGTLVDTCGDKLFYNNDDVTFTG